MILIAFGMMYHDFHNLRDFMGSIGFGTLTLVIFERLSNQPYFQKNIWILYGSMATLSGFCLYNLPPHLQTKPTLLAAFAGLWLLTLFFKLKKSPDEHRASSLIHSK